ncbi:MAG: hypothetical protein ACYTF1_01845 [Planctomycetota bacterium]
MPKKLGRQMMLIATIIYTVDKLLFISNKATKDAYLAASGVTQEIAELVDVSIFHLFIIITGLTVVACWRAFVWYLYMRNEYFQQAG